MQKSGTTSLYNILNNHPDINMSSKKEINFFSSNYLKGIKYYYSFFNNISKDQKITGEVNPGYLCYPNTARRIKNDLGDIKLVFILREPIKRAFSQYWDNRLNLKEHLGEELILNRYLTSEFSEHSRNYFSRGVYIQYINEFSKFFSRNKMHFIIFEELIENPKKELSKLYDFLDINNSVSLELQQSENMALIYDNFAFKFLIKNPYYTKFIYKHFRKFFFFGEKKRFNYKIPNTKIISKLKEFYNPYNKELEDFLGRKINSWNKY